MFDSIRKHQRILQFVLLLLILPAFVFFGVSGYDRFLSGDDTVATVGNEKISVREFEQAQRRQLENLRQMLGGQLDPKMLDTPEARKEVLDGLIAQRVLLLQARDHHITITDERVRESLLAIPGLKKDDGSFDMERYKALLGQQGLNEAMFESQMRRDLAVEAMPEALAQTTILPAAVLDRLVRVQEETREVRELMFAPAQFTAKVAVTPEQLKAYYEANGAAFETPESAKVEFLVLDSQALAAAVTVDPAEVKSYYEQNQKNYATPEERKASHILLTLAPDAKDDAKKAARAKAEDLLKQLRGGADFAALAKANSQDPGSKDKGGDLGFFTRELMVKPFADAAFGLKEGELSGVVESEFGLHIIKLTGIKPGSQKTFEQVRGEIESELRKQTATRKYAENAEAFTNTVYEQSDNLKPAAEKFGLKIQTAEGVTRQGAGAAAAASPLANPKLLAALFAADSIKSKRNTEAVDIGNNRLVSARIVEHKAAEKKPLASVEAEVRTRVIEQESLKLAIEAGKAKLKELQGGAPATGLSEPKVVARSGPPQVPPAAVEPVFKASVEKLPALMGTELGPLGYGIYQITRVIPVTDAKLAERRPMYQQQLSQLLAQQELNAYLESVKARTDIKRHAVKSAPAVDTK